MSNNHYDTPESIFTIPDEVREIDRTDLINHTLARIKGTVMVVCASVESENFTVSDEDMQDCLFGIYGQLEQLEKLIKFEVKEDKS